MRKFTKIIVMTGLLLLISTGCSTLSMERKLAEENKIDTDMYGYDDEEFVFNEGTVQQLADLFRLEELSIDNVNSIMKDEIDAGNYNEVIIFMRHLFDNEETQAAMYTDRYYEALLAHVENESEPSQQLLQDATESARVQYDIHPDDQRTTVQYATLLLYSNERYQEGIDLLFELEDKLNASEEDFNKRTIHALAQAHLINGQYEESLEHLQVLRSYDSDDGSQDSLLYYRISHVLELLGRTDEAASYLERAYSPTSDFLKLYGTEAFGLYSNFFNQTLNE